METLINLVLYFILLFCLMNLVYVLVIDNEKEKPMVAGDPIHGDRHKFHEIYFHYSLMYLGSLAIPPSRPYDRWIVYPTPLHTLGKQMILLDFRRFHNV